MLRGNLVDEYFEYLLDIIDDEQYSPDDYLDILWFLYEQDFTWTIENDSNRAGDGISLREHFLSDFGQRDYIYGPCSVLEMMVALAIRWENDIMYDPDYGDRTSHWFWYMMKNLGATKLDFSKFTYEKAEKCIKNFLNRDYNSDGKGGLFYVKNMSKNMTKIEIWYQMQYATDDILKN